MNKTSEKVIKACEADASLQGQLFDAFAMLLQQPPNKSDGSDLAAAQLNFVTEMTVFTAVPPTILKDKMVGPDYLAAMIAVMHEVVRELKIDVGFLLIKVN